MYFVMLWNIRNLWFACYRHFFRQEIWNADTNQILCNMTASYGDGEEVFNERGYISIQPCLFGHQPGLQFPFDLLPETNITAVKYFNNTFR